MLEEDPSPDYKTMIFHENTLMRYRGFSHGSAQFRSAWFKGGDAGQFMGKDLAFKQGKLLKHGRIRLERKSQEMWTMGMEYRMGCRLTGINGEVHRSF